jgi:hypothetical protein
MKRAPGSTCPDCGETLIEQRSHGRNVGFCIRCGKEHDGPPRSDVISQTPCVCKCGLLVEVTPAMRAWADLIPLNVYFHGSHARDGQTFMIHGNPGADGFCVACLKRLNVGWTLQRGLLAMAKDDDGAAVLFHVTRAAREMLALESL